MNRSLLDCPICENNLQGECHDFDHDIYYVQCPICGNYSVTEESADYIRTDKEIRDEWHRLSGVVRNQSENGKQLRLRTDNIKDFLTIAIVPRDPLEAVDAILQFAHKKTSFYGKPVQIPLSDFAITIRTPGTSKNLRIISLSPSILIIWKERTIPIITA